jgi:hypothetical protein
MSTTRQEQVDELGFVWKLPARMRLSGAVLALVIAAVVAGVTYTAVRYAKGYPSHFDQGIWRSHPDRRRFMLNDLLTSRICIGTPASRVFTLLGEPDHRLPDGPGRSPSLIYELGTPDPLYIDFRRDRNGRNVVYSVLPPFWPRTGCWA